MMEDEELTLIEARLAALRPSRAKLDRDRLMFLAGQASVAYWPKYRPSAARPAAISAIVAAVATFIGMTAIRSGERIADHVASAAAPAAISPVQAAAFSRGATPRRVESSESLGWAVSMLVGEVSPASDSPQAEQGVLSLRHRLLNESTGLGSATATSQESRPEAAAGKSVPRGRRAAEPRSEEKSSGPPESPKVESRRLGARPSGGQFLTRLGQYSPPAADTPVARDSIRA
jgi:hypothetical protein